MKTVSVYATLIPKTETVYWAADNQVGTRRLTNRKARALEVWEHIPQEKQERIISAAMSTFAEYGYRKASAADIAKAAGISKAMIFTYFGTKRGCYEFMCAEMMRLAAIEVAKISDELLAETDFFERLILSAKMKISLLKTCRPLLLFSVSVYMEKDAEVADIAASCMAEALNSAAPYLQTDAAWLNKFKNPEDAPQVERIAQWLTDGCAAEWDRARTADFSDMLNLYSDACEALKRKYYKEEYING